MRLIIRDSNGDEIKDIDLKVCLHPEHIYNSYPGVEAEAGSIVSIKDGADGIPVKSLVVGIEPVQAGSGDPSQDNVRLITGYTACEVWRAGINIFDKTAVVQDAYIDDTNGVEKAGTGSVCSDYISAVPNATYYIKSDQTSGAWGAWYDADKNYISGITGYAASTSESAKIKTAPSNAMYMRLTIVRNDTGNVDTFSVNYPSTNHDYHAYTGETYSITFPSEAGTVYGGSLDVTNGVLTVDRAMVDLGTRTWTATLLSANAGNRFYAAGLTNAKVPEDVSSLQGLVCSEYVEKIPSAYNQAVQGIAIYTNKSIQIYDSSRASMTAEEFKADMSGVQLVYELATPITYRLTPTEVTTLLGSNTIWADTGDTSLAYRADTKLYIDGIYLLQS